MTKEELNERLLAIAEGDDAAFAEVYRAFYQPVYLLAASITRERSLAEDITQEVFITLRQCAGRYRPGGQARAWLFGIAKNVARYFVRRQQAELPMERDALPGPNGPAETDKWETDMEKGCLSEIVMAQALQVLNNAEYRVTVLHVFGGLKLSEIAAFDQTAYGTVLWRYDQAKKKLRRFYTAAGQRERSDADHA